MYDSSRFSARTPWNIRKTKNFTNYKISKSEYQKILLKNTFFFQCIGSIYTYQSEVLKGGSLTRVILTLPTVHALNISAHHSAQEGYDCRGIEGGLQISDFGQLSQLSLSWISLWFLRAKIGRKCGLWPKNFRRLPCRKTPYNHNTTYFWDVMSFCELWY